MDIEHLPIPSCKVWTLLLAMEQSQLLKRTYSCIGTESLHFCRHTIVDKCVHFKDYNQDICLISDASVSMAAC